MSLSAMKKQKIQPFYISEHEAPAKQRILIAALQLFVRDGMCETSIRDIAKASGFTNPALFKHFDGKEALANCLFERCYLELFRLVHTATNEVGTFHEKQASVVNAYLAALDREPESVIFVQEGLRHFWPSMPPEVRRHSILGEIRKLLECGQQEGAVTEEIEMSLLVTAWAGTLQQFARARYFGDFRQEHQQLCHALAEILTKIVSR
jgi:TetR/AcrR family transcriptional regulator, repressor of fatR-cypB operon